MVKKLLAFGSFVALAISASALGLTLDALETGWGTTYDSTTHTITYESAWTGRGWWLDNVDYSAYDKIVVEIEPATITAQLNIEYVGTESISSSGLCDLGATSLSVALNPDYKSAVKQIYVQCGPMTANPTIVITKAELVANDGDTNVLWEGSYTASAWNSGATIANYQVKAGDILNYYITPGSADAQMIVKGEDWKNLLGTARISNNDIIDGVGEVVVNDEMLANCGSRIFLQGDGGMSCTKIEKVGEMELDEGTTMINFGARHLPAQVFAKIPADANTLTIVLDQVPEWIQICDSNWATLVDNSVAKVKQVGGMVFLTFPINADIIAAINTAEPQFVINGDASVVYYGSAVVPETLPDEPLYTVGLEDNTTPWWSAWSPTYVINGDGKIHFDFINYTNSVNFWNNWLAVFVNADVNPAGGPYAIDNELLVLRADNYGWGPLYDKTTLTNDYDWSTFNIDMNGAFVSLDITRTGENAEMVAAISTESNETYEYKASVTGVTSETLGVFLTVEGGHLDVYGVSVTDMSSIRDITVGDAPARYFNINGIEMDGSNLPAGLYIVKQGAKTSKMIIR